MSNYTGADKVTGDPLTAVEFTAMKTAVNSKADSIGGKQLSTEDYTTAEKDKLASLQVFTDDQYTILQQIIAAFTTS